MDKFCIITNAEKDERFEVTNTIRDYLIARQKKFMILADGEGDMADLASDIDCFLVLGGDGTLLQAARTYYERNIPIIGINLGTLGFLTAIEKEEVLQCLDSLIADDYLIENRMMLSGKVYHKGRLIEESVALNDVIVTRSGFSRLVELKLYVNGSLADIFSGDGIIVSTPTGSTGYNLSAGGPVVFPETRLMVITPICPHTLSARSIVVSPDDTIVIEVGKRRKTQEEEALVTFDGQLAVELQSSDYIEIKQADVITKMIKVNQRNFYEILRNKIGSSSHS